VHQKTERDELEGQRSESRAPDFGEREVRNYLLGLHLIEQVLLILQDLKSFNLLHVH